MLHDASQSIKISAMYILLYSANNKIVCVKSLRKCAFPKLVSCSLGTSLFIKEEIKLLNLQACLSCMLINYNTCRRNTEVNGHGAIPSAGSANSKPIN